MLPYGSVKRDSGEFGNLKLSAEEDLFEFEMIFDNTSDQKKSPLIETYELLDSYFVMNLKIIRGKANSTHLTLEQTFCGKVPDATFIKFKPSVYYKWNNKKGIITLSTKLGTLKPELIKKQAENLLDHCKEFYYLYTENGTKNLKNLV